MIYFRADGNEQIASGHIVRCLTLAKQLCKRGSEVAFICADSAPLPMIEKQGIKAINLDSRWDDLSFEIPQMKKILSSSPGSTLLLDTYQASREYVESLLPYASIVYLGSKKECFGEISGLINYSTDIDYAWYDEAYGKGSTTLLLGPSYAPLREEFSDHCVHASKRVRRVLLTTGASDPMHVIDAILSKVLSLYSDLISGIDVVVGRMFDDIESLESRYGDNPKVDLHRHVDSMSALMLQSDLAISANGTTVYELAACAVPTISFAMVDEQVSSGTALGRLGIVEYCGCVQSDFDGCIAAVGLAFEALIKDSERRNQLASASHALIDGAGCERIIEELGLS